LIRIPAFAFAISAIAAHNYFFNSDVDSEADLPQHFFGRRNKRMAAVPHERAAGWLLNYLVTWGMDAGKASRNMPERFQKPSRAGWRAARRKSGIHPDAGEFETKGDLKCYASFC
jgi:hypothetical protein